MHAFINTHTPIHKLIHTHTYIRNVGPDLVRAGGAAAQGYLKKGASTTELETVSKC